MTTDTSAMDPIEQRARKLLAAEFERDGHVQTAERVCAGAWDTHPSILAIVAGLRSVEQPKCCANAGTYACMCNIYQAPKLCDSERPSAPTGVEGLRQLAREVQAAICRSRMEFLSETRLKNGFEDECGPEIDVIEHALRFPHFAEQASGGSPWTAAQQPAAVDEATKRDAERYRWLRSCTTREEEDLVMIRGEKGRSTDELHCLGALDAAIDAALAAQQTDVAAHRERVEQPSAPEPVADGEVRLWDTQWLNIVNHDNRYRDWDKADAINHAVKMTEQAIARNVADGKLPPPRIGVSLRGEKPSVPEELCTECGGAGYTCDTCGHGFPAPRETAQEPAVTDPHRFAVVSSDYSRPFLLGAYQALDNAIKAQCGSPEKWHIFERYRGVEQSNVQKPVAYQSVIYGGSAWSETSKDIYDLARANDGWIRAGGGEVRVQVRALYTHPAPLRPVTDEDVSAALEAYDACPPDADGKFEWSSVRAALESFAQRMVEE